MMYTLISLLVATNLNYIYCKLDDPAAFTAIKGGRNAAYISFQAIVVQNKVCAIVFNL